MSLVDKIRFFAVTDVGRKRVHNEDSYLIDKDMGLFIVADGMGGHAAGEVASSMAVRIVHEVLTSQADVLQDRAEHGPRSEISTGQILGLLEYAVKTASDRIHAEAQRDTSKRGMGTTLSLLLVIGSRGYVAHVGDSRIYMVRDGVIHQVTEDHTIANELLRLGMVTPDEVERVPSKNAITRAVGVYQHAEVDTLNLELLPNDQFVLASDGLTGYLDDAGEVLNKHLAKKDGDRSVQGLIDHANEKGGKDNITAVLVRLGRGGLADSARARRLQLTRDVLHGMPLFSRLNERELLRVMQAAEVYQFEKDEVVVKEGEEGDQMFVTLQGRLQIETGQAVLDEIGPGEHLGEMALLRSTPRSATVTALEPSELIAFRRADFFDIIRTEPHIAVKLLWEFLGVLADRLEQTSRDLSTAREELDDDRDTQPPAAGQYATDPFSQPVTRGLGHLQLGFSPPLAIEQPPSTVDNAPSFDEAPEIGHRIEDSPSFDEAPELAARIEDSPSFDEAPELAARVDDSPSWGGADNGAESTDDALETPRRPPTGAPPACADGLDVPFDARQTRPGRPTQRSEAKTRPIARAIVDLATDKSDEAAERPSVRERQGTLRSAGTGALAKASAGGSEGPLKETKPDVGARGSRPRADKGGGPPDEDDAERFLSPRATVPLSPQDELQNELDALRTEFKERLKESRKARDDKDSD
ncbi:MAG: cyclic nucleotide-binding domain-containing protein [Deltaproteobacteria bacterium]|nr:cyclic nucleotide-binding domain-containing protein [Deltaproteobacteria bacterium]